jgi:hypothetical protein
MKFTKSQNLEGPKSFIRNIKNSYFLFIKVSFVKKVIKTIVIKPDPKIDHSYQTRYENWPGQGAGLHGSI